MGKIDDVVATAVFWKLELPANDLLATVSVRSIFEKLGRGKDWDHARKQEGLRRFFLPSSNKSEAKKVSIGNVPALLEHMRFAKEIVEEYYAHCEHSKGKVNFHGKYHLLCSKGTSHW